MSTVEVIEDATRGYVVTVTHPNGLRTTVARHLPRYRAEQLAAQYRSES